MSKRLVRIFQPDIIEKSLDLVQREVSVVLKSNHTLFGKCIKIENNLLHLQDLRFHEHIFALTQIESVIYDQNAPY